MLGIGFELVGMMAEYFSVILGDVFQRVVALGIGDFGIKKASPRVRTGFRFNTLLW